MPTSEAQILLGSVGWEDEDDYYFLGADDNDGHTLVRVQLFEGRDFTKPLNPDRAQGHKIICHLSGGLFRIPKKDTLVHVSIPKGMEHVVGAGVIFATIERSPSSQFAQDRAVMDFGDDTHLIIKGKSVSLQDPDNRFLTVGTPRSGGAAGLTFQAKDGTGGIIQEGVVGWFVSQDGAAKTILQMTPSKVECTSTSGGYWKVDADFYSLGSSVYAIGGAVYLGRAPTVANMALWGPTGIAGVASPSVYISPV
jgi:hypothetical protein